MNYHVTSFAPQNL